MSIHIHNRRTFLKAGSTALAIPMLDSLCGAKAAASNPKRMLFIGCGFGFTVDTFFPTEAGRFADIGLTPGMAPLERHRDDITMVSNLTNLGATNPHGGSTSYLTGANVNNTPGKKFHNSVSLDQVVGDSSTPFHELVEDTKNESASDLAEKAEVWEAIKQLPERSRKILQLRFIEGRTLEETGQMLDLTRARIKQIQDESLKKLQQILKSLTE